MQIQCTQNCYNSQNNLSFRAAPNRGSASSLPRSRIGRAARTSSATQNTDTSSVTDFIKDVSIGLHIPTVSQAHNEREETFLSTFNSRWWAGGFTIRTSVNEVNGSLRSGNMSFSQEEGQKHLRSLAVQGKLAIRHERVYHLDQDPGPDAPEPRRVMILTPTQQFTMKLEGQQRKRLPESPFKNITEARFREFDHAFYFAVAMSGEKLFKIKSVNENAKKTKPGGSKRNRNSKRVNKEDRELETLGSVMKAVNEHKSEEDEFSIKEVSAALAYMQKMGRVRLWGDNVELVKLE